MYEEVILVGNKCDFEKKSWEVDTHTGQEVNNFTKLRKCLVISTYYYNSIFYIFTVVSH